MKKNAWMALGIVLAVLLAAIAAVSKLKGGCTAMLECANGVVPMKCHWTYIATSYAGAAGAVTALMAAFAGSCEGRRLTAIAAALFALVAMLLVSPLGIGTCSHADSLCNGTASIIYGIGAVAIVLAAVMAAKADPAAAERPTMSL
ncbi:MAG: DUF4418 family protein [Coriobacteriales bacterium]